MMRLPRAFTLVELLVVISLIAPLIAILLPALSAARSAARTSLCMSNMRTIAQAMHTFANDNDGRFPGRANLINISDGSHGSSWRWHNMLRWGTGISVVGQGTPGSKHNIHCPNFTYITGVTRWIGMNNNAAGGNRIGDAPGRYGDYGNPPPSPHSGRTWEYFYLGARADFFRQPAYTFLMREVERGGSDYVGPRGGSPTLHPLDGHLYDGGHYAFRHRLTATFPFIDGHVERLGPDDNVNSSGRYSLRGRD